jgi:hypothetical protein
MGNTHKCKACGREFKPDSRNCGRQSFCPRRPCQRLRRTLRQKQRRQRAVARLGKLKGPEVTRGLQTASVLSEADLRAEKPVIIGLISMITGLTNLEDLERVYRQLWIRGRQILSANQSGTGPNPAIISLLDESKGKMGGMG